MKLSIRSASTIAMLSYFCSKSSAFSSSASLMGRTAVRLFAGKPTTTTEHSYDYDMVVIGGGSGGVRASRIASGHGAKVALIETQLKHGIVPYYSAIGGTCVNVGCVPKKLMVFAARFPQEMAQARGYGWNDALETGDALGTFDWSKFMEYKDAEISRLNNVYENFVLKNAGVEVIQGYGSMVDAHTIQVDSTDGGSESKTITAQNVVIAVGGWPTKPGIPGEEHSITSNEIFYLEKQPKRVVVVGGGFIALEFASILDGLGSDVTVLYRGDLFLRGFDDDLRSHLQEEMQENTNIDLQLKTQPQEIIKNDDGTLTVVTSEGDRLDCDQVLMATGRQGKIDKLKLDAAGITTENSFIPVNEYSQTNVDNIFAIGDVTNRMQLTPVALMEGHSLADTLYNDMDRPVKHEYIASTVFTNPEVGTVGYTEAEAVEQFGDVTIYKTRFRAMKNSFPKKETYTFFKLVVDTKTDRVVGVHIATEGAGEMIQGVAIAVKMGATKADFDSTVGIHPTSAEELVTMRSPAYRYENGVKVEE